MINILFTDSDGLWLLFIVNTKTGAKILYHESTDYFETLDIYNQVRKTLKIRD